MVSKINPFSYGQLILVHVVSPVGSAHLSGSEGWSMAARTWRDQLLTCSLW